MQLSNEGDTLMEEKKMIKTRHMRVLLFSLKVWRDICFILDAETSNFAYVKFDKKDFYLGNSVSQNV